MIAIPLAAAAMMAGPAAARFDCGGTAVVVRYAPRRATLTVAGRAYRLTQTRSASGARYAGRDGARRIEFWTKGDEARLVIGARRYPVCRLPAPPQTTYRALGTEPGWSLAIEATRLTLDYDYGEHRLTAPLPPVRTTFNGHRYEGRALTIDITHAACSDGMSDRNYPDRVTVTLPGRTLKGCGGAALSTGEGRWQVTEIAGVPVLPRTEVSIRIEGDRIGGKDGCNGYGGDIVRAGNGVRFERIISTMMACAPPVMTQSRRFHALLAAARGYAVGSDGWLVVRAPGGRTLRARPA